MKGKHPILLLVAMLAAILTGSIPARVLAADTIVITAADIESETRVTADGKAYRIVQLRSPVGPAAVKAAYPNQRRVIIDSAGRPLADRSAAQKIALIDSALRLHDDASLAGLRTAIEQTRRNHLLLQGLNFSTDLVAKAIGKAARAYLTGGVTIPADLAQQLVTKPQALELKALTEMIVWASLDDADAAFARAQTIAGKGLADYANARAYMEAYYEAMAEFYPTVDYYGEIDHIDNTTLDNLKDFATTAIHNAAGTDAVADVLDELNKLVEVQRWREKRASYQKRLAFFLPGAEGYVEPMLVRYTLALAAAGSTGKAPVLGTATLLSAAAKCDGADTGIALRWTAVEGATRYAIYRDGKEVYLTRSAGNTFWNTTGLAAGQTYRYQVQAVNAAGRGALSQALTGTAPANCSGGQAVRILLDGETVYADVAPVVLDGRTMVPVRAIAEALGAQVGWDDATGTITLSLGETVVHLAVNDATALVDGSPVTLAVPAQTVNGRTVVPLRFLGEAFGAQVDWDDVNQTVVIERGAPAMPKVELVPLGHLNVADKLTRRDGIADVQMGGETQIAARWLDGYSVESQGPYFLELDLDGQYQTLIAQVGYQDGTTGSYDARVRVTLDGKEAARFSVFDDSPAHPLHLNVAGVRRVRFTVDSFDGAAYTDVGTLWLGGGVTKTAVAPADPAAVGGGPDPLPLSQVRLTDKLVRSSGIADVRMGGEKLTAVRWIDTYDVANSGPYYLEFALDGRYQTLDALIGYADETSGTYGVRVRVTLDGKEAANFNVFGDSVGYPLHLDVAGVRRLRISVDLHEGVAFGSGGTVRLAGSVSQLGVPPAAAVDRSEPVPLSLVRLTDKLVRSSGIDDVRMSGEKLTAVRWIDTYDVANSGPYFLELALDGRYQTLDALVGYADESNGSDGTRVRVFLDGREAANFNVFGDSVGYPLHLDVGGVRRLRFTVDAHGGVTFGGTGTVRLAGSVSPPGVAPAELDAGGPEPVPLSQVRLADKFVRGSGIDDVRLGGNRETDARWIDSYDVARGGPYFLEFALEGQYESLDALLGYEDDFWSGYETLVVVLLDGREVARIRLESGGKQPQVLRLDTAGAKRLRISVHGTGTNKEGRTFWIAGTMVPAP